jgi:hypothetical protein
VDVYGVQDIEPSVWWPSMAGLQDIEPFVRWPAMAGDGRPSEASSQPRFLYKPARTQPALIHLGAVAVPFEFRATRKMNVAVFFPSLAYVSSGKGDRSDVSEQ